MTFEKAYSPKLDGNITAYRAKREFFAQDDKSIKFIFFCPDENCNAELTGVNIFILGKFKHKPHFRTKINCSHSDDCSIIKEIKQDTNKNLKDDEEDGIAHGIKSSKYPDEFILFRPMAESKAKIEKASDDDFDNIEPRKKRQAAPGGSSCIKPHKTSYLENIVDSYEDMKTNSQKKANFLTLNNIKRSYKNSFKDLIYFEDGENFIFHGDIKPIKQYGNNYSIKFKEKAWCNNKPYKASIYITEETVESYRLRRLFKESIDELIKLGDNFTSAKCYFIGSYPQLVEVAAKNDKSSFQVLNIDIKNLDHLVIKFTE